MTRKNKISSKSIDKKSQILTAASAVSPQLLPKTPNKKWFSICFAATLIVLVMTAFLAYERPIPAWEYNIMISINQWSDGWRNFYLVATELGGKWAAVAAVAVTFFSHMHWLAWRLSVSIFAGYAAVIVLKLLVDRPRPEGVSDEVQVRAVETLAGFPSGHTMLVTVIMLTLLPYLPKVWRWVLASTAIVLVALSRVYLGVHVPLDVVGGVAVGILVVCFVRILPDKIRAKFRLG